MIVEESRKAKRLVVGIENRDFCIHECLTMIFTYFYFHLHNYEFSDLSLFFSMSLQMVEEPRMAPRLAVDIGNSALSAQ